MYLILIKALYESSFDILLLIMHIYIYIEVICSNQQNIYYNIYHVIVLWLNQFIL